MADSRAEAFVQALADEDCRQLLRSVDSEAKTVSTLSNECGIPLSTTYRKVNCLEEASLVEAKNRIGRNSKPETVYEQSFDGAVITTGDDGGFDIAFGDDDPEDLPVVPFGNHSRAAIGSD